jgi:hypothetical protein
MAHEPNSGALVSSGLLRFSIRQLLIWTAVIALGCVALRSASPGWVAALSSLTPLVLATATLFAVFRQGADRAHWIGFAAFGWLYFLLLAVGWYGASSDPNSWENPIRPYNLATAKLGVWLYDRMYSQPQTQYGMVGSGFGGSGFTGGGMGSAPMGMGMPGGMGSMSGMPGMGGGGPPVFTGPSQNDFLNVAHAFWTLLIAACGGWLARWIYATGPAVKNKPVETAAN